MAKTKEKTDLKKGRAQFNLVGEAKISDFTFSLNKEFDSGWTANQMNIGIDCGNGNVVYADLMGGYFPDKDSVIYVHGFKEDGDNKQDNFQNRFEIDWDDRFDQDIIDTVGENCFIKVGLEKTNKDKTFTKKFLSAFDAVEYISEHLSDGMVVNIKGNLSYSGTGETTYVKKEITSIYLSNATPEKYRATFTQTILLDYDSIGKLDDEKGTIPIDAYVLDYVGKVKVDNEKVEIKKTLAFPKSFEFEVPEDGEEKINRLIKKYFKVSKKDEINEIMVFGNLVEGAAIVNVDWDDVPEDIKELVELGVLTEDEAKTKSAIGGSGSRERRMVITRPEITYVGKDDERKPTVQNDNTKYNVDDLMFINQLIDSNDSSSPKADSKKNKENDSPIIDDDDDDDEILRMLGEIDDED